MTREVAYLYCGGKMWPRLIVSLWTLRKHWEGAVRVYCATEKDVDWIGQTCAELGCETVLMEAPEASGSSPRGKLALTQNVVAENIVYIDADTVVEGDISPMFGYPLALTSHGDWTTKGRRVREQLVSYRGYSDLLDPLIALQLEGEYPHINAGTFGFVGGCPQIRLWQEVVGEVVRVIKAHPEQFTKDKTFVPADTAFQLITSQVRHIVLDDRYNCCCRHGLHWDDPIVRHYCGRRHGRNDPHWRNAFLECRERNLGGICDHPRRYDMETKNMLKRYEAGMYDTPDGLSKGRL